MDDGEKVVLKKFGRGMSLKVKEELAITKEDDDLYAKGNRERNISRGFRDVDIKKEKGSPNKQS